MVYIACKPCHISRIKKKLKLYINKGLQRVYNGLKRAWEADALPLSYSRNLCRKYNDLLYLQTHISTFKLPLHP